MRGLVEYTHFSEQLLALVANAESREFIVDGIRGTICEDPTAGIPMNDPPGPMWYVFVEEAPGWDIPRLVVLYTFDDEDVYLSWIDFSENQPGLV